MTPEAFIKQLDAALREYRFRDAANLTRGIDPTPFTLPQLKKVLNLLRRKRQFATLEQLASIFSACGRKEPVIRRQWAQSLLDQGRVVQALPALRDSAQHFQDDPEEGPELRGLIGRAHKQLYVTQGGAQHLAAALESYLDDWRARRGDYRWHGINLVALSQCAARASQLGVKPAVDPAATARAILDDIELKGASGYWDYATGLEASIALGDEDAALQWLKKYVLHPDADAFEIASTLRQLKEVWRLEESPLATQILPILEHALLQREGGCVEPFSTHATRAASGFEAVYGSEGYVYLQWIDNLYECCRGVARIKSQSTGAPQGTGFLVCGSALRADWGDAPVLLTNSHVMSTYAADEAPLRPEEGVAEFTRIEGRPHVTFGELLYSSPRIALDVTILRLSAPDRATTFEITPYVPALSPDPAKQQRVYVFGHPNGGELVVSMYDNNLVEQDEHYLRYRSPTERGSSGSPVCTRQLKALALHHRAVEERQLNEGVWLTSIRSALS